MSTTELALAPKPPRGITLYESEEWLAALLDSEALATTEQQEQFQLDLAAAMVSARGKRDRMAGFIKSCEAAADFAKQERKRLSERQETFDNAADRAREYTLRIIQSMGEDARGKLRKLEGDSFTMSARACPVSCEITDEAVVPLKFKSATVTFPMFLWAQIGLLLEDKGYKSDAYLASVSVDKQAVKKALEAGEEVPGADLVLDKLTLQIR